MSKRTLVIEDQGDTRRSGRDLLTSWREPGLLVKRLLSVASGPLTPPLSPPQAGKPRRGEGISKPAISLEGRGCG